MLHGVSVILREVVGPLQAALVSVCERLVHYQRLATKDNDCLLVLAWLL